MMQQRLFLPVSFHLEDDPFFDRVVVAEVVSVSSSLSGQNGFAESGEKYLDANFSVKRQSSDAIHPASSLPKRLCKPQHLRRLYA